MARIRLANKGFGRLLRLRQGCACRGRQGGWQLRRRKRRLRETLKWPSGKHSPWCGLSGGSPRSSSRLLLRGMLHKGDDGDADVGRQRSPCVGDDPQLLIANASIDILLPDLPPAGGKTVWFPMEFGDYVASNPISPSPQDGDICCQMLSHQGVASRTLLGRRCRFMTEHVDRGATRRLRNR